MTLVASVDVEDTDESSVPDGRTVVTLVASVDVEDTDESSVADERTVVILVASVEVEDTDGASVVEGTVVILVTSVEAEDTNRASVGEGTVVKLVAPEEVVTSEILSLVAEAPLGDDAANVEVLSVPEDAAPAAVEISEVVSAPLLVPPLSVLFVPPLSDETPVEVKLPEVAAVLLVSPLSDELVSEGSDVVLAPRLPVVVAGTEAGPVLALSEFDIASEDVVRNVESSLVEPVEPEFSDSELDSEPIELLVGMLEVSMEECAD